MFSAFRCHGRVLAVAALLLSCRSGGAAPVPAGADLNFVPADAVGVLSVHVADLTKHPAGKAVLAKVTEGLPDAMKSVRDQFGVGLEDVDRATLFWPALTPDPMSGPHESDPIVGVTTMRPYDQKAILSAAAPDAKERTVNGRSLYARQWGPSFVFLDDHAYLMGMADQLEAYLNRTEKRAERPLRQVLKAADKHLIVGGMDVASVVAARLPPYRLTNVPDDAKPFLPLLKIRLVTLTVDLDDRLRAHAEATFATEADARDGAAAADAALDLNHQQFERQVRRALPWEADLPKALAILFDAEAALHAARAEQKGTAVEISASTPVDVGAATAAADQVVEVARKEMERARLTGSLKELALAAHDYASANGDFLPAAAITDKAGKPLLSWRVALLPYIEQGKLYQEFHLDEPWDGEHNKKLLEKMPALFAPAGSQAFKDHATHYQALVGKGTVFDGTKVSLAQITDGTANTILFVEAKKAVPWTKPEDLPIDADKLPSKLGGRVEGKFMAALCDGEVRFFPLTMKEEALRIWGTRDNGQIRPEPEK